MNSARRYDEALAAAVTASEDTPELFVSMWALSELVEAATRTGDTARAARALARLDEHDGGQRRRLGARRQDARAGAAHEGAGADDLFREAIDHFRGTRLRPELAAAAAAVRRVAAARGPARPGPRAAPARPRAADRAGAGGLRRARAPRAGRDGRQGAQADDRDARRPDGAGGADRPPRPRRALTNPEIGARAVPQPAHRRVAPEEGVHEARHQLAHGAARRAAARGPRGRARLAPGHRTREYPGATAGGSASRLRACPLSP